MLLTCVLYNTVWYVMTVLASEYCYRGSQHQKIKSVMSCHVIPIQPHLFSRSLLFSCCATAAMLQGRLPLWRGDIPSLRLGMTCHFSAMTLTWQKHLAFTSSLVPTWLANQHTSDRYSPSIRYTFLLFICIAYTGQPLMQTVLPVICLRHALT